MLANPAIITEKLNHVKKILRLGWCKRQFAKTERGFKCGVLDQEACSWCLVGAIYASTQDHDLREDMARTLVKAWDTNDEYDNSISNMNRMPLSQIRGRLIIFNDHYCRVVEDVIKLVDSAIERLQGVNYES